MSAMPAPCFARRAFELKMLGTLRFALTLLSLRTLLNKGQWINRRYFRSPEPTPLLVPGPGKLMNDPCFGRVILGSNKGLYK